MGILDRFKKRDEAAQRTAATRGMSDKQIEAIDELEALGPAAVEMAEVVTGNFPPEVQREAVVALGQLGDPRAVEPLLQGLTGHLHYEVQTDAVAVLGRLGDSRAVDAIVALVGQSGSVSIEAAVEALKALGVTQRDLLNVLSESTTWEQSQGAERLLPHFADESAVPELIASLQSADSERRKAAAGALGDMHAKDGVDGLVAVLTDGDWTVRVRAVDALAAIGDPRAVDAIAPLLADRDSNVRAHAGAALAELQDPRASERIRQALASERDATARELLGQALTKAGPARVTASVGPGALRGSLGEPYCSQNCYDRGGATITTALMQGWSGDCSVCRRPLRLALGSPGSMVCYKPGLFLYFHQEPACVEAVRAEVDRSTACVVCGTPIVQPSQVMQESEADVGVVQLAGTSLQEELTNFQALADRQEGLVERLVPVSGERARAQFARLGIAAPSRYKDHMNAFSSFRSAAMSSEGSSVQTWYLNLDDQSAGDDFLYVHLEDEALPVGLLVCALKEGGFLGCYEAGSALGSLRKALGI